MVTFRRASDNKEVSGTINLVQGDTLRLKLDGVVTRGKATHYTVQSSSPLLTISQSPNPAQREQTITLKVSTTGTTNHVTISAHAPSNHNIAAKFFVNILPKLRLPDFATEVGAVAHLLLAESKTPDDIREYGDGSEVFKAMELMRQVLDNRLTAAKSSAALGSYVACSTSSNDLRDIVHANKCGGATLAQFEGFDGSRSEPGSAQLKTINGILQQANNGTHPLFKKSRVHVEKAIEIASRATKSTDLDDSSLLFWRTTGSLPPTPHAKKPIPLAGQNFYALSSNYLKNPNNPGKP